MLASRESQEWIVEAVGWLVAEMGPVVGLPRPLILPTVAHFPVATTGTRVAIAERLFEHLCLHAGLEPSRFRVAPHGSVEATLADLPFALVPTEPEPAATFRRSPSPDVPHEITYHPELLADPVRLVAILAHGLSHAVLTRARTEPPGGEDAWDYATDLGALLLGAGVFLVNSADRIGWEEGVHWAGVAVRCQGWLGRGGFAFGLAVFCELFDYAPVAVSPHLMMGPRLEFEASAKALRRSPDLCAAIARLGSQIVSTGDTARASDPL